jgi:hypothetical protein
MLKMSRELGWAVPANCGSDAFWQPGHGVQESNFGPH